MILAQEAETTRGRWCRLLENSNESVSVAGGNRLLRSVTALCVLIRDQPAGYTGVCRRLKAGL